MTALEEKPPFEFLIHIPARNRYGFDPTIAAGDEARRGRELIKTRILADKMNRPRAGKGGQPVEAGEIFGLALINAIFRWIFLRYQLEVENKVFSRALPYIESELGARETKRVLSHFLAEFPPAVVRGGRASVKRYLGDREAGGPRKRIALQELLILYLNRLNPAIDSFRELREDGTLGRETFYEKAISALERFFRQRRGIASFQVSLIDLLKQPAVHSPRSLLGQLEFIRNNWVDLLSPALKRDLLVGLDVIRENKRRRDGGPGLALPPGLAGFGASLKLFQEEKVREEPLPERYSSDLSWMPQLVLLAKNTFVWLDQLSLRYNRRINRLDQIPEEELDRVRDWGFTGLWLIGIWKRSPASARIKQGCGNQDAIASAYSIFDYEIADELGGLPALEDLSRKLWARGIRLAGDMVPNHMGVYSRWVVERPDYFLQTSTPPFPGYRFTGTDLSQDDRVGIFIEDGYWTRRDAAVVFKRVDRQTGEVRYIYHGNDGTNMPWNDTAQIDFLLPEAREAVIQTILAVARRFPIIRFDAAMVLAREHFQRLWYPPPGTGGAIPSRAGTGLPSEEFNRCFGKEFWREVVDRVASEAPGTLLLAEAFWLLEGYFVRVLGMHRVYNSAFMNMLKMEFNSAYRQALKEILEFDSRILKRLVNFMSNPDEATASAQFGKGDKYFGVCVMMATLPGLVLFGHGQAEGLTEKYGMEFKKAYWNEQLDQYILSRHEAEIFPLLKKRYLFSESDHFELFDFFQSDGKVNEDVFAYSNRYGEERSLVIYHNRFAHTSGWINLTAAKTRGKATAVNEPADPQRLNLVEALALPAKKDDFCIFREQKGGLTYIHRAPELARQGLFVELGPYQYLVFLDWRWMKDRSDGEIARLEETLQGRGVPNIEKALRKLKLAPLHLILRDIFQVQLLRRLVSLRSVESPREMDDVLDDAVTPTWKASFRELARPYPEMQKPDKTIAVHRKLLKAVLLWGRGEASGGWRAHPYSRPALDYLFSRVPREPAGEPPFFRKLFIWSSLYCLHCALGTRPRSENRLDELMIKDLVEETLAELGCRPDEIEREFSLLQVMVFFARWMRDAASAPRDALKTLFEYPPARYFLGCNRFQGVQWFNKESFEELIYWLFCVDALVQAVNIFRKDDFPRQRGLKHWITAKKLIEAAEGAEFQAEKLLSSDMEGVS